MEFQYFNDRSTPIKKLDSQIATPSFTYPNEGDIRFPKSVAPFVDNKEYINGRIEVQDYIATIKYCGNLKHKQDNDVWIGVVWDEVSRGKHNGTVENTQYFVCENNSGSLLKFNKVNHGITFLEAVNFKYKFFEQNSEEYKFLSDALDKNMFIEARRKVIKIEFIGREKAIKKFAEIERIESVDLTNSYISSIENNVGDNLINLKELYLVRTLLNDWSYFLKILKFFPNLVNLNLSENILFFSEEFHLLKKELFQNTFKLKLLILNKMNLVLEDVLKISFTFKSLQKLYLYTNKLDENTQNVPSDILEENFERYFTQLEYLCVDNNKISNIVKLLQIIKARSLQYLNANQNIIQQLYGQGDDVETIKTLENNIKGLCLDFNQINSLNVLKQINNFKNIVDLNILSNPIFQQVGIEKSKFIAIGRLSKLEILNNTFVNKQARRDHEILYLKYILEDYFDNFKLKASDFNKAQFEVFVKENHQQYEYLKKKYFDPIEEILETKINAKANNIKSNSVELKIVGNDKTVVKKFPKNLTLSNLKNLINKLFKLSTDFQFLIISNNEEMIVTDESKSLELLELQDGDIIKLKIE